MWKEDAQDPLQISNAPNNHNEEEDMFAETPEEPPQVIRTNGKNVENFENPTIQNIAIQTPDDNHLI